MSETLLEKQWRLLGHKYNTKKGNCFRCFFTTEFSSMDIVNTFVPEYLKLVEEFKQNIPFSVHIKTDNVKHVLRMIHLLYDNRKELPLQSIWIQMEKECESYAVVLNLLKQLKMLVSYHVEQDNFYNLRLDTVDTKYDVWDYELDEGPLDLYEYKERKDLDDNEKTLITQIVNELWEFYYMMESYTFIDFMESVLPRDLDFALWCELKKLNKPIVYIDMDGVIADFAADFIEKERNHEKPGFYRNLKVIKGCQRPIGRLFKKFDMYVLSTAKWSNPDSFKEKVEWIDEHFECFRQRLTLTHQKNLSKGAFLIDDRPKHGASEFEGEWIHFGSPKFPDWDTVEKYLMSTLE